MTIEDTNRPRPDLARPELAPPEPVADAPLRPADVKLAGIAHLRHLADSVAATPVTGPGGRLMTVAAAQEWADALACDIACAEAMGSQRHRTVPRALRWVSFLLVAVVDLPIMLWLVASVFNVDWAAPWGMPLAVSTVLAVLATTGTAAALHHIGHELRDHKTDERRLERRGLPLSARLGVLAVTLLVVAVAAVMFVRVRTEGAMSGLDGLAVLLAALVALVMLVASALLCWTSFRDGSPERDDLRQYGDIVRPHLQRKQDYQRRALVLVREYDVLGRRERS